MSKAMPWLKASSQRIDLIMEDVQLLFGISQEEATNIITCIKSPNIDSVHFTRGNTDLRFQKLPSERHREIILMVEGRAGGILTNEKYVLPQALKRSIKKKNWSGNSRIKEP
jgi:hypothetical protein